LTRRAPTRMLVGMHTRAHSKRRLVVTIVAAALALSLVPSAGAGAYIYWWQRNMAPNSPGYDYQAHNHTYNEMYFGPNAGWRSEIWERTPAGYRHFVKQCYGNCFFYHPGYYYTYAFCANRDYSTHFVYDCMNRW
jgi:hypothetical protein